jgi:DNA-binding LytR/AlgR family response regulator
MVGKYAVLIVDDEPAARSDLKKILNAWHTDFDVIAEVASTQEAWQFIQKNRGIDGIFLDIHIQTENESAGLILAAKINRLPHAPWIIFISGYTQKPKDLIRVHPADYLLKPLEEVEVDEALEWIRKNHPKNPKRIIAPHYVINRFGEREKHTEYIDLDEVIYVAKNLGTNSIKIYF